jgi:hypothetical protein
MFAHYLTLTARYLTCRTFKKGSDFAPELSRVLDKNSRAKTIDY